MMLDIFLPSSLQVTSLCNTDFIVISGSGEEKEEGEGVIKIFKEEKTPVRDSLFFVIEV